MRSLLAERTIMDCRNVRSGYQLHLPHHCRLAQGSVAGSSDTPTARRKLLACHIGPSSRFRGASVREACWLPKPSSMLSSPESPKARRDCQRASMRMEVVGEHAVAAPKKKLEEIGRVIGSPGLATEEPEGRQIRRHPSSTLAALPYLLSL